MISLFTLVTKHFRKSNKMILYVFFIQAAFITILTTFVITIIASKFERRAKNIFLLALFISHLSYNLLMITYWVLYWLHIKFPDFMIQLQALFISNQMCYTMMMSIDRYLAVRYPFWYDNLSIGYIYKCIGVIALLCVVFTIITYLSNVAYILGTVILLFGSTILASINIILYQTVKKHFKSIQSLSVHETPSAAIGEEEKLKKQRLRSLKMCSVIVCSFVFLWTPFIACVFGFNNKTISPTWFYSAKFLAHFNPVCDFVVLVVFNREMKDSIQKYFTRKANNVIEPEL